MTSIGILPNLGQSPHFHSLSYFRSQTSSQACVWLTQRYRLSRFHSHSKISPPRCPSISNPSHPSYSTTMLHPSAVLWRETPWREHLWPQLKGIVHFLCNRALGGAAMNTSSLRLYELHIISWLWGETPRRALARPIKISTRVSPFFSKRQLHCIRRHRRQNHFWNYPFNEGFIVIIILSLSVTNGPSSASSTVTITAISIDIRAWVDLKGSCSVIHVADDGESQSSIVVRDISNHPHL